MSDEECTPLSRGQNKEEKRRKEVYDSPIVGGGGQKRRWPRKLEIVATHFEGTRV